MNSNYMEEKRKEIELINKDLKQVFNILKPEVEKLGLSITYTNKNKYNEELNSYYIVITHKDFSDYEATINASNGYNEKDKAHFYINHRRVVITEAGTYSDGSKRYNSEHYDFIYKLSNEEAEKLGLEKDGYSYSFKNLYKTFKRNKNPKLIIKDILPLLEKYLNVIKIVTPRIDEQVNKENDVLAMQNRLYKFAEYYHGELKKLENLRFDIKDYGEIKISSYGTIEVTKTMTEEELLEDLKR